MNSFRYKISLRVWHPSLDPAEITSALRLDPCGLAARKNRERRHLADH